MRRVRAVVYDAVGATPYLTAWPEPDCPVDGVVVAVGATGVCRSDWHAWRGHDPVPLPHVGGHELAGTVLRTGPAVRRFAVGDRVTVPFVCGCGTCPICAAGDPQVCPHQTQPGFTHDGSFAEQVALYAADANLVRLPADLSFVAAASLGCRFATAYRALVGHARVQPEETVAIFGCGGVGLSAIMISRSLGARVIAVDVSPTALDRARRLGADVIMDPTEIDVPTAIHDLGGAHVSVDALGSPTLLDTAVRSLRRRGRHVQVGLLLGDQAAPPVPMDLVISRELLIFGSHGMAAADYPAMLAMITDGRLDPGRLLGRVIRLDEIPAALAAMDRAGSDGLMVAVP
ncbi:MAG: zinc-dependent alcohol dehydrogenase family protein [Propionibacteriaceae bacterium]